MSNVSRDPDGRVPAILFATIALLIGFDVLGDYLSGTAALHLSVEFVAMALASLGVILLWREVRSSRAQARELGSRLDEAHRQALRWREEARETLAGLGAAIDRQFERWRLTPSEREIGLLLLKGLSHREVAALRRTTERTVRQQAFGLYRKAGLGGRTELAAFFLEDLLLPSAAPGGEAEASPKPIED